ncbi:MAG: manganese efflux pump [Lachnospiraceae bacterium]|nr:manganese efflux pump [Lachnospiraceae bacterium]
MNWSFLFFFNSALLGLGLAADAFSVSLANGLSEPKMKPGRMSLIAGVFGGFQGLMPLIGWVCIHTVVSFFQAFEKFVPWIALVILLFIGTKMIIEALKGDEAEEKPEKLGTAALIIQGVATSIDALSAGFTIAEYRFVMALVSALIIAAVTFVVCLIGLYAGKRFGMRFSKGAAVTGGVILILIGIEIVLSSVFGL